MSLTIVLRNKLGYCTKSIEYFAYLHTGSCNLILSTLRPNDRKNSERLHIELPEREFEDCVRLELTEAYSIPMTVACDGLSLGEAVGVGNFHC